MDCYLYSILHSAFNNSLLINRRLNLIFPELKTLHNQWMSRCYYLWFLGRFRFRFGLHASLGPPLFEIPKE